MVKWITVRRITRIGIRMETGTGTGMGASHQPTNVLRRWMAVGIATYWTAQIAMMKMVQFIQVHRKCATAPTMTVMVLWMIMTLRSTTQNLQ